MPPSDIPCCNTVLSGWSNLRIFSAYDLLEDYGGTENTFEDRSEGLMSRTFEW